MLTITARALTSTGTCPSCGQETAHVHSYYTRTPQDLPVSGKIVQLALRVRRFRCPNPQCSRQTFAERLPNVPVSARQTSRLGTILESIAVVLSGQAGSRLARSIGHAGQRRYPPAASQKEGPYFTANAAGPGRRRLCLSSRAHLRDHPDRLRIPSASGSARRSQCRNRGSNGSSNIPVWKSSAEIVRKNISVEQLMGLQRPEPRD
jgi:hypothetical protein